MRKDILYTIFPILLITLLIISGLLLLWSRKLVKKIEHLKIKVDNLSNDEYKDDYVYEEDDELKALSLAIDKMRENLKKQENYKNQMYQNISHDFKTPLTVIKSYIEAIQDGVQTVPQGLKVIEEQVNKLELKVHSLLYLNKLNYFKERKDVTVESVNVQEVMERSIEKMKTMRPDVKWVVNFQKNQTTFKGTYDMWEAVVDNILNNFVRYAESEIKVTIRNHKVTFYNDGPKLDEKELENIFTPYKKGINGQFGLGLSIVKETIAFCGYEVSVKNEKKGVSFMIQ
ncbi:MAG: HAMP domain-containing histidine kinase [Firmicutes bacterium]|nr:HAMP domain-containing histidine kinase [Bacillota bacterium]